MADRSPRDLPYGHFGVASYNADESTWRFERRLTAQTCIQILGEPRMVPSTASTAQAQDKPADKLESLGQRHRRQLNDLAKLCPGLPPISDTVLPLLRVSDAVQNTARRHDSFKGQLFEYGRIKSKALHRSVPVAAMVTGEAGSTLRIAQVQIRRQGWGDDKKYWLEVPAIHGEETLWDVGDGPIQQIRFAQLVEKGDSFLAVRYLTRISIFRPTYEKVSADHFAGSSISPNLLYSIESEAARPPHVDVNFNPWYPQQVGVVDQNGAWTVQEFESSKMARVTRSWTGKAQHSSNQASALDDGWSRIAWICNLETVAVCTRQSLGFFSLASDEPLLLSIIDLSNNGNAPWVLDFVVLSRHPSHCFVLTPTHILVYQVHGHGVQGLKAAIKAKIRHFKNPDDLSMRLSVWSNEQGASLLLLSNTNKVAAVYRFELDGAFGWTHGKPLGPWDYSKSHEIPILDLQVHPLRIVNKGFSKSPHPTRALPKLQFLLSAALRSDYSVTETLLYSFEIRNQQTQNNLPVPTWEAQSNAPNPQVAREPFIVDDAAMEVADLRLSCPQARRARKPLQPAGGPKCSVDLELITDALQSAKQEPQQAEEILEIARSAHNDTETDVLLPNHTLHSLAQGEILVQDIQHISGLLDEMALGQLDDLEAGLSRHHEGQRCFKFGTIPVPDACGLDEELSDDSLTTAYNYILANWVGALSDGISGRVRLAKVSMARHIATEVLLATRCLQVEDRPDEIEVDAPPVESQTSDFTWSVPVRASRSLQLPSSPWGATQPMMALPTPSPTATPSVTTASSNSTSFAAPELYRLSKYATFSKPSPLVLPRPLKKVLSHWTTGASLNDYDWLSTSKHISRQEEDEVDVDMTEKERKAMQRRAERHIKRQRKEAAASQAQQLASSQAPEILSASQPVVKMESQPAAHAGSSQSYGTGAAVASQVMPGRFGGRPPPKKKRKSGF